VRQAADAEDLAQETLLKAFGGIGRFREGSSMRAWLLTILRHAHVDRLRRAGANVEHVSLDDLASDRPGPDSFAAAQDARADPRLMLEGFEDQRIIDALQDLPEGIRWTLLLVDVEGLGHPEAAGILGVPVGTVKSRAHRGRLMLRDALLPLARERRLVREDVDPVRRTDERRGT
jgi:RNA polymerase sigma-70 factor (ECF subfamily)